MPNEKLFSAKEAAQAVLAKAQEMLKSSSLSKADEGAPAEKDQSGPDGVKADPNPAAPNNKINGNPAPGALPQNEVKYAAEAKKGHLALAKFMGRMEHKRSQSKPAAPVAAAPMDKGEGVERDAGAPLHRKVDYDKKGDKLNSQIASEGAKDNHVNKLAEIKSAKKPNLV